MPDPIPTKNDPLAPLHLQMQSIRGFRLWPLPEPHERLYLRVGEAAEWLRRGAPGRALEVLETILVERESTGGQP